MPVALDAVVKQLEDSGIIAPGKLQEFIPPKAAPKDGEALIRELFKQNHLTRFQAQQVASGRAKSLILGGYVLLDKIGAGGMGQVFKAEHRRMKRLVAIKMLPSALTKDPAAVARFQREVEAAAKLRHPNIVAADDADEANGVHFLVMEYVEGSDLSALVKKHGTLPGTKALSYILQAAKGLEFAHKKGVVHRDIKPANLLVDYEGTVKILDMGLARIDAKGDAATQGELTSTGAVMGTVDYMAPEQALSTKGVDSRADIYSLGCTLYYLLAGKCTYDGDTLMAKLLAHREAPIPSLADVQEGVPADVQALFSKMVAKKAEDRYQSMTAVIADIERILSGQSAPGSLAPPQSGSESGLSKIFQQSPGPASKTHRGLASEVTHALLPAPAKKTDPRLLLYGSIGGGIVALVGIALVLYLAFSGDDAPPEIAGPKQIDPPATIPSVVSPAAPRPVGNFALRFDQRGQRVEAPNVGLDITSPFTIEAYVTPAELPVSRLDLGQLVGISNEFHFQLEEDRWRFYSTHNSAKSSSPMVPNRRVHLAGVRSAEKRQLFVDGQMAGEFNEPLSKVRRNPSQTVNPLVLESPRPNFTLLFDQLRISQTVRYTQNFTPPPLFSADSQTLALYRFDEGTGTVLRDSSGKGHHGKISGATWVNVDGSPISSAVPAVSVATGPAIDLLKTAKTDGAGALQLGGGPDKQGGAPYFFDHQQIPAEYALELDLQRQPGSAGTEIFLVVGGGQSCSAMLAPSANPATQRSGITLLDNLAAGNPQNPTSVEGNSLRDGQTSRVVCEVRKNAIRVVVDGRTLIDWTGDPSRLSPHVNLARSIANLGNRLGLVQWSGKIVVQRALLRPLVAANLVYLDDLPEMSWKDGHLQLGKHNLEFNGWKFTWRGQEPAHSLSTHPKEGKTAVVTYRLNGQYDTFSAIVGFGDGVKDRAESPLTFRVTGDGRELWKSPPLQKLTDEAVCAVSVSGIAELGLAVSCSGGNFKAHGVWFEPRLTPAATSSSSQPPVTCPATSARWPFDPADGQEYVWSVPENLGTAINTSADEMLWSISADERQLYFERDKQPFVAVRSSAGEAFSTMNLVPGLPKGEHGSLSENGLLAAFTADGGNGYRAIWLATRKATDQPFSTPQLAPPPINDGSMNDRPVFSPDGLMLLTLATRNPAASAEIWLFTRPALDQPFDMGERLGSPPNTPLWDMPYYISNDRCFLIASSQGPGGNGNRIVRYFTRAKATDPFGTGVEFDIPLGDATRTANSGFRLAGQGRTLYFDSPRLPGGHGKFDLWVTRRVPKPNRWPLAPSKPEDITWLQGLQATVTLRSGPDQEVVLKPSDAPPTGPATIVGIQFSYNQGGALVTDQVLQRVATLGDLESLKCVFSSPNSPTTAAALPNLASLVNLRVLALGRIGPSTTDPAFLAKFQNLESLALQNLVWQRWEPHVAQLQGLKSLDLYSLDDAQLEQLGPLPNLANLRFAGYATGHPKRLPAAERYAKVVPWCRIKLQGLDSDNNKVMFIEPTAPLPGFAAPSSAATGSSSGAAATSDLPVGPDHALERKVAQWLLDVGLDVYLTVQGARVLVRPGESLPAEPFTIGQLGSSDPVTIPPEVLRAGLLDFVRLCSFTGSYLPRKDADTWAEAWGKIPTAGIINAAECDLTDAGIAHLARNSQLKYLNLGRCSRVTGAGLAALAACQELGTLELDPDVFAAGKYTLADTQKLRAALPSARIQFAGGMPIPGLAPAIPRPVATP